jgi:sRNA-binding regulator protein Hfq
VLRNGFSIEETLTSVGPYDLMLESEGGEVLVPLHALLSWEQVGDAAAPSP